MKRQSDSNSIVLPALAVGFMTTALTALALIYYYSHLQFQVIGNACEEILKRFPDSKQTILEMLKEQKFFTPRSADTNLLTSLGYDLSDFCIVRPAVLWIAMICFCACVVLFLCVFQSWRKRTESRINRITACLEKINTGGWVSLWDNSEDEYSRLQDEIYKTVASLYQTRDAALQAKNNFAENLSNIAHQLKTPITAVSLSVQMMKEHSSPHHLERIERQIHRLTQLEEALLLLSRIDAGTLKLKRKPEDVFTILTLASDNLQELVIEANVSIDIPEMGSVCVTVDLDWTMEAVMNLMKNCMEASPPKTTVHCYYEENPLYVQIQIWDEGQGFEKEELPHLFERFYRGKHGADSGIGIGLSMAKSIIEMQNGVLRAFNHSDGGACFEIRFYCH